MGLIYLLGFELMAVLTAVALRILVNRRRFLEAASVRPPADPAQAGMAAAALDKTQPIDPPPAVEEALATPVPAPLPDEPAHAPASLPLIAAAPSAETERMLAGLREQSESLHEAMRSLQALSTGLRAALDKSNLVEHHDLFTPAQQTFDPEEPAAPTRQDALPIEIDFDLSEDAKILQDLAAQLEEAGDAAGALKIRRDLEVDEKWAELTRSDRK